MGRSLRESILLCDENFKSYKRNWKEKVTKMAYNTEYSLSVLDLGEGDLELEDVEQLLAESEAGGARALGLLYTAYTEGLTTSWYDHERDMRELSRSTPGVVYALYGRGEEDDDLWIKYFKDGKMQESRATIVFDPYDEEELQ